MGYGYIGSYVVFGFPISQHILPSGLEELAPCLHGYKHVEEKQEQEAQQTAKACLWTNAPIRIKEFGCEDEKSQLCVVWGTIFVGGEIWSAEDKIATPFVDNDMNLDKMRDVENSYDARAMQAFCKDHGLDFGQAKWRSLGCFARHLY